MTTSAIENAYKARLATIPGIPKAWPNDDFDPKATGNLPYIACDILRAATTDDTLDGEHPIIAGRLLATVVVEKGKGTTVANRFADLIAGLFPMGLRLPSEQSVMAIMSPPHIREGYGDGTYWRVVVSIPFQTEPV